MLDTFEVIKSRQNPLVKEIRAALRAGQLTDRGLLPFEGPTLLQEAVKSQTAVESLLVTDPGLLNPSQRRWLKEQHTRVFQVGPDILNSISGTETPNSLIGLARVPRWDLEPCLDKERGLFIVLAELQDPGNLGTILRSSEAFGVTALLTTRGSVNAYNAKSVRASAGSIFRVPIFQGLREPFLFQSFEDHHIPIVGASLKAREPADPCRLELPMALIVGSEAKGLSDGILRQCRHEVRIDMNQSVQSLNAAIAASILLYEIRHHEHNR